MREEDYSLKPQHFAQGLSEHSTLFIVQIKAPHQGLAFGLIPPSLPREMPFLFLFYWGQGIRPRKSFPLRTLRALATLSSIEGERV